jgi:ribosomal-protein-alanine N-acetyltransferase
MTLADLPAVLEIDHLSFVLPWPERSYRFELSENPAAHLMVAEMGQENHRAIVGYVGYWLIVDEAHISTIAVDPGRRGQGLGELLLSHAMDAARNLGADMATLEVRASNEAAINLYRKFGFQVVGRRAAYYRDNEEDALLMTLTGLSARADEAAGAAG